MATYKLIGWSDVWNELQTLISTVWPEVNDSMRTFVSKEINWSNAFSQGSIIPPLCIIHGLPFQASENWQMNLAVFETFVRIYYIMNTELANVQQLISDKMEPMLEQLLTAKFQSFQVLNTFVMDDTESNELNYFQLQADTPYFAGCIGASIIIIQRVM